MGDSTRIEHVASSDTTQEPQCGSSPAAERMTPLDNALEDIHDSFDWLSKAAYRKLEALRRELKAEDEPSWSVALAEAVLGIALSAAGAKCGAFIVEHLFAKERRETLSAEFVKKLFEEGLPKGIEAAKEEVAKPHDEEIDAFMDAYERGVDQAYHQNQLAFTDKTRREITSLEQATQLRDACSDQNMEDAADNHVLAARDAWVTYVEQSKFGGMATQEMRDEVNARVPGWMPDDAPTLEAAFSGGSEGVLEIEATLPEIQENRMSGSPEIRFALLNGVNERTRAAYEHRPLSQMNIPRQIRCRVEGDMPNFDLNLDEHGGVVGWLRYAKAEWLRARAMVGKPAAEPHDDNSLEAQGLALLLQELIPDEIGKSIL